MPRSIEAFSLILLESLRSLKASLVNADTRLLKVDLLPAHRSPPPSPPTSRDVCRCRFIRIPFLILIISLFSLSKGYFQSVAINSRKCTYHFGFLATIYFSPSIFTFISIDFNWLFVSFNCDIFLRAENRYNFN